MRLGLYIEHVRPEGLWVENYGSYSNHLKSSKKKKTGESMVRKRERGEKEIAVMGVLIPT